MHLTQTGENRHLSDVFESISKWLLAQALEDVGLSDTIAELGQRLIDGGVPVNRINIGRAILHPVIGLVNLTWEADTAQVVAQEIPRKMISIDRLTGQPFFDLNRGTTDRIVANFKNPEDLARYALFQELADQGMTGYAAFGRSFGRKSAFMQQFEGDFRGAVVSFTTRRFSGFSQSDLDGFERLLTPLWICLLISTERLLATELLETYLGRISGKQVLTGQNARGDVQTIDCALFYSDMRNSLGLSQEMNAEAYMATVNQYFDCTAQAVLDHGGEVLKLIGDGIMAIFPFQDDTRPPANMCAAALSAAREAFARAEQVNATRAAEGSAQIDFGIALHVGSVLYGNVGTEKRLDFTATGPAVGLVSRCEALTRPLATRLIATEDFSVQCAEPARPLGAHAIRGFEDKIGLVTYPAGTP